VWFNPSVPEAPALTAQDGARHTKRWRSRWALVGALVVVVVVGAAIALVPAWRAGRSAATAGESPRFVDETSSSGIDHIYDGEFEFFVGGGVAAFDCNDDGRAELYFAGGTEPAALYRNESAVGGALHFARQASPVTDLTAVTGAYPLDIDSDGHVDLAVLRRGGNVVLRGRGDCRFEDANEPLGVDGGDSWTAAFSATWEGSNVLPTLAFGNYLLPDRSGCDDSQLVRPVPTGDGYASPVALSPGYCTLSILFSDWARSGGRDLRVSNDRHYYREGEEQLWRIVPGEAPQIGRAHV